MQFKFVKYKTHLNGFGEVHCWAWVQCSKAPDLPWRKSVNLHDATELPSALEAEAASGPLLVPHLGPCCSAVWVKVAKVQLSQIANNFVKFFQLCLVKIKKILIAIEKAGRINTLVQAPPMGASKNLLRHCTLWTRWTLGQIVGTCNV